LIRARETPVLDIHGSIFLQGLLEMTKLSKTKTEQKFESRAPFLRARNRLT
jgi:hypothetical protein